MNRLCIGSSLRTVSVLVVQLLLDIYRGESRLIGSSQPVVSKVGDDVILPCHLDPAVDVSTKTLEWTRPDLNPRFVYVSRSGQDYVDMKNPSYKGRTSLFNDELKRGNISLKLSNVKPADEGRYRCYFPDKNEESFIELIVGAVSSPGIRLIGLDESSSGVVLQCESKGWYPQPEVLWLDGEGNVLSAGPTETVRGPDDLYTVSSRLTVDKTHGNNITCRVQQTNINQSRETHIYIPDDFFMSSSSCAASVAFSVLFGLLFIFTVSVFVWKLRQNKTDKEHGIIDELMAENKILEDLDKKKTKLDEDLQRTQKEQKDLEQTLIALTELMEELKKQKEKLTAEMDEQQKLADEIHKKIKSVDEEVDKKEGDKIINRGHGYLKLKAIFKEFNWKLEERKKEQQSVQMISDQLMKPICYEINRITERKKEAEKHMEQIQQQLKETEAQKEKILNMNKKETDNKNIK